MQQSSHSRFHSRSTSQVSDLSSDRAESGEHWHSGDTNPRDVKNTVNWVYLQKLISNMGSKKSNGGEFSMAQ